MLINHCHKFVHVDNYFKEAADLGDYLLRVVYNNIGNFN